MTRTSDEGVPAAALRHVLDELPPAAHAFGYGSAVFAQPRVVADASDGTPPGAAPPRPSGAVVDCVLAVESPRAWHAANMARNPAHYAPHLRALGPSAVVALADRVGVGFHYNTLVPWPERAPNPRGFAAYKYGVVSVARLREDLRTWRDLFGAGRMQKPVLTVGDADAGVAADGAANLDAALALALLSLPETFDETRLHEELCAISYRGDVRLVFGAEAADKVASIAAGSAEGLRRLYADAMRSERVGAAVGLERVRGGDAADPRSRRTWGQDTSERARSALFRALPSRLLLGAEDDDARARRGGGGEGGAGERGTERGRADAKEEEEEEDAVAAAAAALARRRDGAGEVRARVAATVARGSRRQALASALATSPWNSVRYAASKLAKAAASRRFF